MLSSIYLFLFFHPVSNLVDPDFTAEGAYMYIRFSKKNAAVVSNCSITLVKCSTIHDIMQELMIKHLYNLIYSNLKHSRGNILKFHVGEILPSGFNLFPYLKLNRQIFICLSPA